MVKLNKEKDSKKFEERVRELADNSDSGDSLFEVELDSKNHFTFLRSKDDFAIKSLKEIRDVLDSRIENIND